MGYLFLFIALLAGITKGFCGKKTSFAVCELKDAVLANTIRMLLCIVIGFIVVCINDGIYGLKTTTMTLCISALSGFSTSMFVVSWLLSVRKGAYMMLDVFLMLGTILPLVASYFMFDEVISSKQIIGFFILIVAVLMMCSYNNSIKTKLSLSSLLLLILTGISGGLSDFSQKLFTKSNSEISIAAFNFYTYLFSAISLMAYYFIMTSKNKNSSVCSFVKIKPVFGYILTMSLCIFLHSYFKTLAATQLPAAQIYPLSQALSMILSTFMAAAFFGEKITSKCVLGIATSFIGLLFINIL